MSPETDEASEQESLLEHESNQHSTQHKQTTGAKMPKRKGPSGSRLKKYVVMCFEILYWLLTLILVQFWKACTAVAVSLMLTYWMWGGWATFFLMIAALIGKSCQYLTCLEILYHLYVLALSNFKIKHYITSNTICISSEKPYKVLE